MPTTNTKRKTVKKATKKSIKKATVKKSSTKKTVAKKATKKPVKKVAKKTAKEPTKKSTSSKKVAKKTTNPVKKTKTEKKEVVKKTKTEKKEVVKKTTQDGGERPRYFKVVVGDGAPHGRFSGSKPKQAAAKALTSILRARKLNNETTTGKLNFSIKECTRGSRHKVYNYVGERIELPEPVTVNIDKGNNPKQIVYKYHNKVMKDKTA